MPVAVLGAVAAVVLGLQASARSRSGSGSGSTKPLPLARTAEAGSFRVSYPPGWHIANTDPVPRLHLSPALVLASSTPPSGQLIIGMAATSAAAPLPQAWLASNVTGTPAPQIVPLGSHRFFRVLDPRLFLGALSQSLYALPARGGTVLAVCRTASQPFTASCERVLSTLRPRPGASLAPIANAGYARRLTAVLAALGAARRRDAAMLAAARTASVQARAAAALAAAHAAAARAVAALRAGVSARANAALATALRRLGDAYARLAAGASHADPRAYRAAQRAVAAAGTALSAALAQLQALGYRLR